MKAGEKVYSRLREWCIEGKGSGERLLTGAVLIDEQQGGYRVRRPNLGRGKFQIWKRVSQGCPLSLVSSPSL